jgi:hypothetical protein
MRSIMVRVLIVSWIERFDMNVGNIDWPTESWRETAVRIGLEGLEGGLNREKDQWLGGGGGGRNDIMNADVVIHISTLGFCKSA